MDTSTSSAASSSPSPPSPASPGTAYANAFRAASSTTHSVSPSDHSPNGRALPDAPVSISSAGRTPPSPRPKACTLPACHDVTSIVSPSDHSPNGRSPSTSPRPNSAAGRRALSASPYAYNSPSTRSATHSVVPSDHSPFGASLPAVDVASPRSSSDTRPPSARLCARTPP